MIELEQHCVIERHGPYGIDQQSNFESVWVNPQQIESLYVAGFTRMTMKSGAVIEVRQSPQDIFQLAYGKQFAMPSFKHLKEQPHEQ